MIHEEQELPSILEDFPNYRLRTSATIPDRKNTSEEEFRFQVARQYLTSLEQVLRTKLTPTTRQPLMDQALDLYDNQFNKVLANSIFRDFEFPSSDIIESKFDVDFDTTTKLFYNETCFRHSFSRFFAQAFNVQTASDSWANYEMLFETLIENSTNSDLPLPASWIWDILDEYVYQFYTCSRWRKNIRKDDLDGLETYFKKDGFDFWNLEKVIKQLNTLVDRSEVLSPQFQLEVDQLKTIHYLGFYSLLALVKVHVMVGSFDQALALIQNISSKTLLVYSRSGGAYLTLFSYAGFSYLMTNRFREAATLFRAITLYYNKYKQLYSKSFQFEQMNKTYEKIVCLLAISLVFYPEPLDDALLQVFKEIKVKPKDRQNTLSQGESVLDKFEKLNKYDTQTFSELFFYSSPKIVQAILDMNDFRSVKQDQGVNDLLNGQKDKMQEELLKVQKINNISSLLKLYTRLTISKSAKLLQTSEQDLNLLLSLYRQRSQGVLQQTQFEQSVIKRYQSDTTQLNFTVENDVITVIKAQETQRDFGAQIAKMNTQFEKILKQIEKVHDSVK